MTKPDVSKVEFWILAGLSPNAKEFSRMMRKVQQRNVMMVLFPPDLCISHAT